VSTELQPRSVSAGELVEIAGTPQIRRREAFAEPGLWAGLATTTPGATSGWHHHDGNDTVVVVQSGRLRIEFADGRPPLDAGPGGFLLIPRGLVHREVTTADGPGEAVVVRFGGDGPATVEVDDPSA
jgi:uncharacterized RmlC-like cupin family protein